MSTIALQGHVPLHNVKSDLLWCLYNLRMCSFDELTYLPTYYTIE